MSDYISRQAAVEKAMEYCPDDDGICSKAGTDLRELLDDLENLPSADVKPVVHSYWEKDPDGGCVCHKCRERPLLDGSEEPVLSDFCPSCGADMRGGELNG